MLLAKCAKNNLGYPIRGGRYNILFILFVFVVVVVGTIDKASLIICMWAVLWFLSSQVN